MKIIFGVTHIPETKEETRKMFFSNKHFFVSKNRS